MKKKTALLIIIILSCLFVSLACSKKTADDEDKTGILLNGCETIDDIRQFRYVNFRGNSSLNKQTSLRTQGRTSLKLFVESPAIFDASAKMAFDGDQSVMPTIRIDRYDDDTKIKEIQSFSLDVYSETNMRFMMYIVDDNWKLCYSETVLLTGGEFNNLFFNFNPLFYSNYEYGIRYIDFVFVDSVGGETFYIDNFRKNLKPALEAKLEIKQDFATGEILKLDNFSDLKYINFYTKSLMPSGYLGFSQGTVTIDSLRINGFDAASISDVNRYAHGNGFVVADEIIKKIDFIDINKIVVSAIFEGVGTKEISIIVGDAVQEVSKTTLINSGVSQEIVFDDFTGLNKGKIKTLKIELSSYENTEPTKVRFSNLRYERGE